MPYERFYKNIPKEWKVRRAKGSPSFREMRRGEYIIMGDERIFANDIRSGSDRAIGLRLSDKTKKEIAVFNAITLDNKEWNINHREIMPVSRGLNLGRLCFRLMEFIIKEKGGEEAIVNTTKKSVINTLLGLGWKVDKHCEIELKGILGIGLRDELPALPEIRQMLRKQHKNDLPVMILLRRNLA
ncbi:MAG: hypothetical protein HYW05_02025 [Candidatus Diapherotrites archaeon]|nr:hypothetical protein [Candidatus Diapherotrites archaeon]